MHGPEDHPTETSLHSFMIDFSKLSISSFEKIPTARGMVSKAPLQDKTNLRQESAFLSGESYHQRVTTVHNNPKNNDTAHSLFSRFGRGNEHPMFVGKTGAVQRHETSTVKDEIFTPRDCALPTSRTRILGSQEAQLKITGTRELNSETISRKSLELSGPLLRVRSPPLSKKGSPTPTYASSLSSSDRKSYTEIFRDTSHVDSHGCPRELFPQHKVRCSHSGYMSSYSSQPYEQGFPRCDKCGIEISTGSFREHNRTCEGKKCNRCFKIVIGSYEAHKRSCLVRRCDRCGIIPRNSFKEHNKICKKNSNTMHVRSPSTVSYCGSIKLR